MIGRQRRLLSGLLIAALAAVTAACGGGGGSGNSDPPPAFTYNGMTTPASITDNTTATAAASAATNTVVTGDVPLPFAASASGTTPARSDVAAIVSRALKNVVTDKAAQLSGARAVTGDSGSLPPGSCGGSASYSASVDYTDTSPADGYPDPGTTTRFLGSVTFNNYCESDVSIDVLVSGTVSFDLTITWIDDGSGSGGVMPDFDTLSATITLTNFSIYARDSSDGKVYWAQITGMSVSETSIGSRVTITSARVYHPTHGYVTVRTIVALDYGSGAYPIAGKLEISDGSGHYVWLTANGDGSTCQMEVDLVAPAGVDGPAVTKNWSELM